MRYLIAATPPADILQSLRDTYQSAFKQPFPVAIPHITLVPTFTPKSDSNQIHSAINNLHLQGLPAQFTFGPPSLFQGDSDAILYLPVTPREPLDTLHQKLTQTLEPFITYDLSVYPDHQLPSYDPHLSLDYHFHPGHQLLDTFTPTPTPFNLTTVSLLHEPTPNTWQIHTIFNPND